MTLMATDVSEQKHVFVDDVPDDATVAELLDVLVKEMDLPAADSEGRPLLYQALHTGEGRHLRADERVGESLTTGTKLVLQPTIDAGRW
jgi:hypothetical protein